MNTGLDNKIFLAYCGGLIGLFSGGYLYGVISDTYQLKWKKSCENLIMPNSISDLKVSNFLNKGSVIGGIVGLSYGYFKKPFVPLLIEYYKSKN